MRYDELHGDEDELEYERRCDREQFYEAEEYDNEEECFEWMS